MTLRTGGSDRRVQAFFDSENLSSCLALPTAIKTLANGMSLTIGWIGGDPTRYLRSDDHYCHLSAYRVSSYSELDHVTMIICSGKATDVLGDALRGLLGVGDSCRSVPPSGSVKMIINKYVAPNKSSSFDTFL